MTSTDPTDFARRAPLAALICAALAAGGAWLLPVPQGLMGAVIVMLASACAGGIGMLLSRVGAGGTPTGQGRRGASPADARHLARLAEVAQRTTNAVALIDAAQRVEWINPAFEQVYGYRLDDLRGRTLRDIVLGREEDLTALERIGLAMDQGRSAAGEYACRHRDGREVISRVEVTPLRDANGELGGFIAVHDDVTEQRRAERDLRASEARFRLLTEAAPIMAWIEDEHGVCQWFNEQWVSFVGRDMTQDRGEGWLDHVHPDDRERTRTLSRAASAARAPFEARYRLRRHDGVYRHVFDRGVPRWDESGTFVGYVGAVMDISQLEDQQRAVEEMRNYLVDAIESIDGGVVIFDAEDRLVLCNQRYKEMFDLPDSMVEPGLPYRQQLLDFYRAHPEFCDGRAPEEVVVERLRLHRSDTVWERRFGERWVQVRERATPSGGLVSLRMDITAVKHAEAALRERQEFLELAVRATNDGLWDWNVETDELYFSPRFHELLGYPPGSLPTRLTQWVTFLHESDRPEIVKVVRRASRTDQGATQVEYRCRMADGGYRWFCARGMAVHDEQGRVRRLVGSISDIHERKTKELELVQARRLLQEAIDSVDGGLVMFDIDDRLVFANQRYREIYGFSDDDALPGTHLLDITRAYYTRHPEHLNGMTLDAVIEQRRLRHRGPQRSWEMQLGRRWFQVNDRVLADGSVISLRTDITALKEATAALNERRELLEIVVHASHDGLWDWYVQTDVLYTSPRLKALLGYRDDELGSDWGQWHSFIHPDDVAAFDAAFAGIGKAGELEVEYRMHTKHGEWRWFRTRAMAIRDDAGAIRRVAGSTSDINEQKLREQESARARELLDEAIEAMDAGIVRFDAEDRLVFCNRRYREMYGLPDALSVPGTQFRDILTDFFVRNPACRGRLSIEDVVQYRLTQHRQASGVWEQKLGDRWLLVSDRPTADGGVVSLRTDIGTFKRIEEALSLAKSKAEAASVAKTQFLANVSHELRTPLNGVIGMLQMLDSPAVPPPYADYVNLALRSGRALLELINDLLDGAKIEAGRVQIERVPFEPLEVIADARAAVETAAREKGLSFVVDVAGPCAHRAIGDPTRLRQVLTNLLGNAVKFTHEGSVTLRVRSDGADHLRFEVRDTGIGIPAEMQALIFEPFTQAEESTTRRFGGTGLGLSICRSLVRLMGGELEVDSKQGRGSRFSFELHLPAAVEEPGAIDTPDADAGAVSAVDDVETGAAARVLVVDDVEVNLHVMSALLRRLGAQVTAVGSGREAIACATSGHFDIVFMDCQMPVMDGFEATRALRARLGRRCPPIVAMTANTGEGDRLRAAAAGMVDYLTKPVELSALREALQRHVVVAPATLAAESLDQLRKTLGVDAFAELVSLFESTVTTRLDALHAALERSDYAAAAQLAHAIAGVSANLGATRLASLAGGIENSCRSGAAPSPAELEELPAALGAVRAAVASELVAA